MLIRRLIFLFIFIMPALPTKADPGDILIILSSDTKPYQAIVKAFQQYLDTRQSKHSFRIQTRDVEDLSDKEVAEASLHIAVGTVATQVLLKKNVDVPLLSTLVTNSAVSSFRDKYSEDRKNRFYSIVLDQPPQRVMLLGKILLPDVSQYGFLIGEASKSLFYDYEKVAGKLKLQTTAAFTAGDRAIAQKIEQLLEYNKAIIALPDPQIMTPNTAKWLLFMSYQKSIPVIGYSNAYVKAGALAAVHSTPEDIGRQAAEWVETFFAEGVPDESDNFPSYFRVAVNRWVARSLTIEVDDEKQLGEKLELLEIKQRGLEQ